MRRMMSEIEEDKKKQMERAKEILGKYPETPKTNSESMEKALKEAREAVKKNLRRQLGREKSITADESGAEAKAGGSVQRVREAAEAEASGGRPRLPGDEDVTRGEIDVAIESSSS